LPLVGLASKPASNSAGVAGLKIKCSDLGGSTVTFEINLFVSASCDIVSLVAFILVSYACTPGTLTSNIPAAPSGTGIV
jgi:hypothetical protein